jgi:predicted permease
MVPAFIGPNVFTWKPDVEGQSKQESDATPTFAIETGNAEYFRTFGMRISRGRGFTDRDVSGAPRVAVVSEAVAKLLWPGRDPIGRRLRYANLDTNEWRTVVGVADDVRFRALRESTPTIYLPWRQAYTQGLFAIRSSLPASQLLPTMRAAIRDVAPALVLVRGRSMNELLADPLSTPRLSALLMSALGVLALLLSVVGLYGVMSSIVRDQTREIGIRIALGATQRHIRTTVLADALRVIGAGVVVGLVAALLGSRLLTRLLFEISPSDPIALLGSSLLLVAAGLLAAWLPARRAARVEPTLALRSE